MLPVAPSGWVPIFVPSAVERTFVTPVVPTSWPTVNAGVAAEEVAGAKERRRVRAAQRSAAENIWPENTDTTTRAGIGRFIVFSPELELRTLGGAEHTTR